MSVTIQILEGETTPQPHQELSLDKTTVLIGRGSEQDVRLTNASVSRRHCVIEKREGQWYVTDENSENGTVLNGQRVSGQKVIHHEDVLEVGEVMLRVGLDRKLKDESKAKPQASVPGLVRGIIALLMLVLLTLAAAGGSLLWNYKQAMDKITAKLPVTLEPGSKEGTPIFRGSPDERILHYSRLPIWPGWQTSFERPFIDNPEPEWNMGDIWTTQADGWHPRLFEGLDLNLEGGEQAIASSYFFLRNTYMVRDDSDPFAILYIEIEGWGGLGERYANKATIPAVRRPELPGYVHAIKVYPPNVQEQTRDGLKDLQTTEFTWTKTRMVPPLPGDPIGPPKTEGIITPSVLIPPKQIKDVPIHGMNYTFFKDGCRYSVAVHGSENLLARFDGKLGALAEAVLNSVKIDPPATPRKLPSSDELAKTIKNQSVALTAHSRRPVLLGYVSYVDLLKIRNLLLDLQTLPQPAPGEEELRRLYFMIRDRTQSELLAAMSTAYDGRFDKKSAAGEAALKKVKTFLGGYPPLTMKRRNTGYPEWAWYFEEVASVNPYQAVKGL